MSDQINSDVPESSLVPNLQGQKVRITAEEWGAKARDKIECYHQVGHVFGAYLPPIDNITSWHLRDLVTGTKKMIKGSEVQHLHVPFYDGLEVKEFIKFMEGYPFVQMCLPDRENEIKKMGRQYLINVIYTRCGDKFKKFVDDRVNARHLDVKEEGNKFIELDPEIAKLFVESKAVSTSNGSAYHLFKASATRRRTKKEIEQAKIEEKAKKTEIELKMEQFAQLQEQVAQMQQQLQNQKQVLDQGQVLYDQGLVKQTESGDWIAVSSYEEHQSVLQKRASEAQRVQQLEQEVNVNPPPNISDERQRPSQQLELAEPLQNLSARPQQSPNSGIPTRMDRIQSRRAAANASKIGGRGADQNADMK